MLLILSYEELNFRATNLANVSVVKQSESFLAQSDIYGDKSEDQKGPGLIAAEYVGIIVLNLLSALFSGLVLGLLSLDITDLEILRKCGTEKERKYAARIIPMRKHSNLLLCSLVLGNVIVNSFLQVLLDRVFPGIIGFIGTTICITLFGEILPQAVCSRYGLAIGANTIWITWIVIAITFPVSYPFSLILDCCLGDEIAFVYDRERLQEYIRITRNYNNLDAQEINIITGALKIKKVKVGQIMTKLKDVFMLDINTMINHNAILGIVKRGFSRIPVFDRNRKNVVGLLMVKDLALINPLIDVTLRSILSFYKHPIMTVDENHRLDIVLNHFREGKSHMAVVMDHKKKDILGIVTLEDIIEEVLQVEINDETDVVTDNRELRHRPDAQIPCDLDSLHLHLNEAMLKRRGKEKVLAHLTPPNLPGQVQQANQQYQIAVINKPTTRDSKDKGNITHLLGKERSKTKNSSSRK